MNGYRTKTNIEDNCTAPSGAKSIHTAAGTVEFAMLGNGSGRNVIMLSHGVHDWSVFTGIAMDLVRADPALRVVVYARPGCGGSTPIAETIRDPLLYEASAVLPALMDALDINSASLVGHADGASVALIFAGLFPDRVLSVAGLASYGFADDYFRASLESGPRDECIGVEPAFQRWKQDRLSECLAGWNATAFFGLITAPVLLIHGLQDEFISMEQIAVIAKRIPGQVDWVALRNCGHWFHRDNPEQIVLLLQGQLLRRLSKAPNPGTSAPRRRTHSARQEEEALFQMHVGA